MTWNFVRRKLGLSQVELGKRGGIDSTTIVQVERGLRKLWPELRKLMASELCVLEGELFNTNGWPMKKFKKITQQELVQERRY